MGEESAVQLAKYLKSYRKLEYLDLHANGIMDDGCEELLLSLEQSAKSGYLKHLDISSNYAPHKEQVNALCKIIGSAKSL